MTTAPVKPIPVSNDEQRAILYWALMGLGQEINRYEEELTRHRVMLNVDQRHIDVLVVSSMGITHLRRERIASLEDSVYRYHKLLKKLHALKKQADDVKMDNDVADMVASVRAHRRAEKDEADAKKIVGEG